MQYLQMEKIIIAALLLLLSFNSSAQEVGPLRGIYIDGVLQLLNYDGGSQELVKFAKDNEFNYLALYLTPAQLPQYGPQLSDLINALKSEAGVLEVGATLGSQSQLVLDHNNQFSGKFDVLNLENEYWGGAQGTPEREDMFNGYINELKVMKEIAEGNNLKVEAYIGWPTQTEMAEIVQNVDRLLVHTYVSNPSRTYPTIRTRFQWISDLNSDVEVMPIYSVETTEAGRENGPVFMGQWMRDNSPNSDNIDYVAGLDLAESIFEAGYDAAVSASQDFGLNVVGHQYFAYTLLNSLPPAIAIDSPALNNVVVDDGAATPIEFVARGLHANQLGVEWYQTGVGHVRSLHFNGSTTNSITINATPPYTVTALPFDRRGRYGSAISWKVSGTDALPTGTAAFPESLDVYLEPGETHTFVHQARDVDGNLFAADWYSNGYLGRSYFSPDEIATSSRDIQFDTAGTFRVFVDLFDRAWRPDGSIEQRKVAQSVSWAVHVGSGVTRPARALPADFNGRFVMIRKAGTGTLSLAEVQVFVRNPNGGNDINVALRKIAVQSTTSFTGLSSRAVDGGINGNWNSRSVTHTEHSSSPWWRVDLGDTYDVRSIIIWNRSDCCNQRLNDAVVYIGDIPSNNPADYTPVGRLNGGTDVQVFRTK